MQTTFYALILVFHLTNGTYMTGKVTPIFESLERCQRAERVVVPEYKNRQGIQNTISVCNPIQAMRDE